MANDEEFDSFIAMVFGLNPEEISLSQISFPSSDIRRELYGAINRGVMEISPLEEIVSGIVAGYLAPDMRPKNSAKTKNSEEYRVEQALKFLTGKRNPTRKKDKDEALLLGIAQDYLQEFSTRRKNPKLDRIIVRKLQDQGISIDAANRSNQIKPIRDAFNENRRRLLSRVATRRFMERELQSRNLVKVFALLRGLHVKFSSDLYDKWLIDGDYGGNR